MKTATSWPTNRYGNTWRHATLYFDWRDEQLLNEAIETINPLKITVRIRPAIVVGPIEVGSMSMADFADVVRDDDQRFCAVDPERDLDGKCAEIEKECDQSTGYFVLGLARLDLANQAIYDSLLAVLQDRRERFSRWMPHIEF